MNRNYKSETIQNRVRYAAGELVDYANRGGRNQPDWIKQVNTAARKYGVHPASVHIQISLWCD